MLWWFVIIHIEKSFKKLKQKIILDSHNILDTLTMQWNLFCIKVLFSSLPSISTEEEKSLSTMVSAISNNQIRLFHVVIIFMTFVCFKSNKSWQHKIIIDLISSTKNQFISVKADGAAPLQAQPWQLPPKHPQQQTNQPVLLLGGTV